VFSSPVLQDLSAPPLCRNSSTLAITCSALPVRMQVHRLALEKRSPGARYHAVADEGVPFHEIAGVIGRRLKVPVVSKTSEEATNHFGWFAPFAALDAPASSVETQKQLGWRPTQASLLPDIDRPGYVERRTLFTALLS
jgi:hypothetical protein